MPRVSLESTIIPLEVQYSDAISHLSKMVYGWLYARGWKHGSCFHYQRAISEKTRLSLRQVQYCLMELERIGLVQIPRSKGQGNVYKLPWLRREDEWAETAPKQRAKKKPKRRARLILVETIKDDETKHH